MKLFVFTINLDCCLVIAPDELTARKMAENKGFNVSGWEVKAHDLIPGVKEYWEE